MSNSKYIIQNVTLINEGEQKPADVWIKGKFIEKITFPGEGIYPAGYEVIAGRGKILIPGVIDDHVHFREPGFEYKADMTSESMAAVAGGVTSFMEMPNTDPPAVTVDLLEEKYLLASRKSLANYSFYLGATNYNAEELLKVEPSNVCGVKVFMGSSTGNLLVDNEKALHHIFERVTIPVAVHCEDDGIIERNNLKYLKKYGMKGTAKLHPFIRSAEACYLSVSKAVALAEKHGTRLHLLHLSTAREMDLLDHSSPLHEKKITAEVCVHHLWFNDEDYEQKGNLIKWNPAVKSKGDRDALRNALNLGKLDVVATDHAPHTLEEKQRPYFKAPSGGPMIQHSLISMLELAGQGVFSLETVVEKMCHNPATIFGIHKRGFVREGYFADLVLLDLNRPLTVSKENILYKCGWSPMEGERFHASVLKTFVNGKLVYDEGKFYKEFKGDRLTFDREEN